MRAAVFVIPPESIRVELENLCKPVALASLFPGRPDAPLEIDLGCGDGSFLLEMAARTPEHNFLGVERLLGRVRRTCRGAGVSGLANVRVIRVESHYLLRYLLPLESVTTLHLMFPDPWPKRRHLPRRLVQTPFLDAAVAVLRPGGELRLTTDDLPYYKHMRAVFGPYAGLSEAVWEPGEEYPQTDFERGFRGQGLPIYRALLRK